MKQKSFRDNGDAKNVFRESEVGILIEQFDAKLDLLVEGHTGLDKKVDGLDKKVDTLDKKVDILDARVDGLDKKVDVLGTRVDVLDKKVDVLGTRVDVLDKKVDVFKDEVDHKLNIVFDELHLIRNELKEKVSRDEFIALEKRVVTLERKRA